MWIYCEQVIGNVEPATWRLHARNSGRDSCARSSKLRATGTQVPQRLLDLLGDGGWQLTRSLADASRRASALLERGATRAVALRDGAPVFVAQHGPAIQAAAGDVGPAIASAAAALAHQHKGAVDAAEKAWKVAPHAMASAAADNLPGLQHALTQLSNGSVADAAGTDAHQAEEAYPDITELMGELPGDMSAAEAAVAGLPGFVDAHGTYVADAVDGISKSDFVQQHSGALASAAKGLGAWLSGAFEQRRRLQDAAAGGTGNKTLYDFSGGGVSSNVTYNDSAGSNVTYSGGASTNVPYNGGAGSNVTHNDDGGDAVPYPEDPSEIWDNSVKEIPGVDSAEPEGTHEV